MKNSYASTAKLLVGADLFRQAQLLLELAESIFGPRVDPYPYEFTGVEFGDRAQLRLGNLINGQYKSVWIRLSETSSRDAGTALWQLTHEVVHLLCAETNVSILEEGVAEWYQREWVRNVPDSFPCWAKEETRSYVPEKYRKALELVDSILCVDLNSIRRMRDVEPNFNRITPDLIRREASFVDNRTAEKLVKKFISWRIIQRRTKEEKLALIERRKKLGTPIQNWDGEGLRLAQNKRLIKGCGDKQIAVIRRQPK